VFCITFKGETKVEMTILRLKISVIPFKVVGRKNFQGEGLGLTEKKDRKLAKNPEETRSVMC